MIHKTPGIIVFAWFAAGSILVAQQQDQNPGLLASYANGSSVTGARSTLRRVDPDVQFHWGAAAPLPGLSAERFSARWQGKLLAPVTGPFTFSLYLGGKASLQIDGNQVLDSRRESAGWVHATPVNLQRGLHEVTVEFTKTNDNATIGMYWSTDSFPLEPVIARWLFHESEAAPTGLERGRDLIRAYRCQACHRINGLPQAIDGPSLVHLSVEPGWLAAWIQSPKQMRADSRMPSFDLSSAQAEQIATYLLRQSQPAKLPAVKGNRAKGKELFETIGCYGCHSIGALGNRSPLAGGSLDRIGEKRSVQALKTWLTKPELINPKHRMPVFKLAKDEADHIAQFLASRKQPAQPANAPNSADAEKGRELIERLRCSSCHEIPGIKRPAPNVRDLHNVFAIKATQLEQSNPGSGWTNSCLQHPNLKRPQPGYSLAEQDQKFIKEFLASAPDSSVVTNKYEFGRALLREKNCVGCHERGLEVGLLPLIHARVDQNDRDALNKSRGELQPPSLASVGDKFHDRLLSKLVEGDGNSRRPWLKVRMPRFQHSKPEREAILGYLVDHDRIPEVSAEVPAPLPAGQVLAAGQRLVSPSGFGCMSCHTVGTHQPKGVAVHARGSDLQGIAKRIRHRWFRRWLRNPARIVPGMEMPALATPIRGVLDGKLDHQIESLWAALNSPDFVLPSVKDSAVQIVNPESKDRAVVLRDVIFDSPPGSKWCPRPLAIGLTNSHNLMFDLETLSLRSWWLGDFARERTEGKTWLWEPGGLPFWNDLPPSPSIALLMPSGKLVHPEKKGQTFGWLERWEHRGAGAVSFQYRLRFPNSKWLTVFETIAPHATDVATGFQRQFNVRGEAPGQPVVTHFGGDVAVDGRLLRQTGVLGEIVIDAQHSSWVPITARPGFYSPMQARSAGHRHSLIYSSRLARKMSGQTRPTPPIPPSPNQQRPLELVPGCETMRLSLHAGVMPTAISFTSQGDPVVSSLNGGVFVARDTDADGYEDTWLPFSDHLAAPFGVFVDGEWVHASQKPEVIRMRDLDGDGRADESEVVATGWGYNDNYHDWTFGLVRDAKDRFYVALGSNYQQKGRSRASSHQRGHILRIQPDGKVEDIARGLRFTAGIAMNRAGDVFFTDNQGEQNTFNEINHLVPRSRYGVPALHDPSPDQDDWTLRPPAVKLPHPLTRSVNGICFLDGDGKFGPFEGHGIGCEYDTRALVRFTLQRVGDTYQGACYRFSLPETAAKDPAERFLGPISCAVSPGGELYVGSFRDSGWGGANNIGELVKIRFSPDRLPAGIREVTANRQGFVVRFTAAIDTRLAADPANYQLSSYRRVWKGNYATPDSDRRADKVDRALVAADGLSVQLMVADLRPGFLYDVHLKPIGRDGAELWPADAYYTMNVIPRED